MGKWRGGRERKKEERGKESEGGVGKDEGKESSEDERRKEGRGEEDVKTRRRREKTELNERN